MPNLTQLMKQMKDEGGSRNKAEDFVKALLEAATPEERQRVISTQGPLLLQGEQAVALALIQAQGYGEEPGKQAPLPTGEQWFGRQPEKFQTATRETALGGGVTQPGQLPLGQLSPVAGRRQAPGYRGFAGGPGFAPGQPRIPSPRGQEAERRLGQLKTAYPTRARVPQMSEAWKKFIPGGTEEVLPRRATVEARAEEVGTAGDILEDYKKWRTGGRLINEAEEVANVIRDQYSDIGKEFIKVLLEEYPDPEWTKDYDEEHLENMGIVKDKGGRYRFQPSPNVEKAQEQTLMVDIARTPIPKWAQVEKWRSTRLIEIGLTVFGAPGIDEETIKQAIDKNELTPLALSFIDKPLIEREGASYREGILLLRGEFTPAQVKWVETLANNPVMARKYKTLLSEATKLLEKYKRKTFWGAAGDFLGEIGRSVMGGFGLAGEEE